MAPGAKEIGLLGDNTLMPIRIFFGEFRFGSNPTG